MQQVTFRVPASTSNLGPGFDCLGVALRIYNDVTISRGKGGAPDGMVAQAASVFFSRTDVRPFAFRFSVRGEVPISRGLGSSVTIRLGTIHGLNRLAGQPLTRDGVFDLCVALEGHPDNAAPAAFGGFNVIHRPALRQRFSVGSELQFVLLIPDFEVATEKARALLPSQISRMAAVESCASACSITAAFVSRQYRALRGAFHDGLHQPFRKSLVPHFDRALAAAADAGALGAFLSGSGSTIAAVAIDHVEEIRRAMQHVLPGATVIVTRADNRGARQLTRR